MSKFCQSCGMPLKEENNLGTEKDGTLSTKYCNYCYQMGEYTEPNLSLKEMKVLGLKGIDEGGGNAFARWLLKLFYPMQLKNLERWKK